MDKKGAVPVPYIIALILGIVVVGLLGYWFIVLGGRVPGTATQAWCEERRTVWCNDLAAKGFDETQRPSFPVKGCDRFDALGCWENFAPGCTEIGVGKPSVDDCRRLLGLPTTT